MHRTRFISIFFQREREIDDYYYMECAEHFHNKEPMMIDIKRYSFMDFEIMDAIRESAKGKYRGIDSNYFSLS